MSPIAPKESRCINILFISFVVVLCIFFISQALRHHPENRYVLLSFDVESVDQDQDVLDVLDVVYRQNISATFFVTGEYAAEHPEMIKLMTGREIGCHGYSHKAFTKMTLEEKEEEIRECKKIVESITGKKVTVFRAPYNRIDKETLSVLDEQGFIYDASIIKGLSFIYPSLRGLSIGEIPVSSVLGIPLEDVVWLYYLKLPGTYFYILQNKKGGIESYLFHPHHISQYKNDFDELINHLKDENAIFISHTELTETDDEGV